MMNRISKKHTQLIAREYGLTEEFTKCSLCTYFYSKPDGPRTGVWYNLFCTHPKASRESIHEKSEERYPYARYINPADGYYGQSGPCTLFKDKRSGISYSDKFLHAQEAIKERENDPYLIKVREQLMTGVLKT
jgi:hypothetical protein